jgi:hypothetical protein
MPRKPRFIVGGSFLVHNEGSRLPACAGNPS